MTNTKNKQIQENSPFYYFYSTGCVFCKQVDKFVEELNKEGHDILRLDASEPENKEIIKEIKKEYNIKCGTPWLVNIKTGHNICGLRDKETIEKWLAGEKIEPLKRPNSPMPKPPFKGASKKEETKWKKDYKKWIEENSHLPNLKTSQEILDLPRPKSEPPNTWRAESGAHSGSGERTKVFGYGRANSVTHLQATISEHTLNTLMERTSSTIGDNTQ